MKKWIILFIIAQSSITVSCGEDKNLAKYNKAYKSSAGSFQLIKYYSKPGFKNKINKKTRHKYSEFYEVHFDKENNLPVKEVFYYKNMKTWEKDYHYRSKDKKNFILKSATTYNNEGQRILEDVYLDGKPYVTKKYYYFKKAKTLSREERYQKGGRQGWWLFYNTKKKVVRKEQYLNNKLNSYWIYIYSKKGELLEEKNYNSSGKIIYRYRFLPPK
ncbi:MAG: hypothetical protein OEZ36_00805 [Spirochaetota bacterium]|nr:hypothetical protein [Spirochaetota bacterium]